MKLFRDMQETYYRHFKNVCKQLVILCHRLGGESFTTYYRDIIIECSLSQKETFVSQNDPNILIGFIQTQERYYFVLNFEKVKKYKYIKIK